MADLVIVREVQSRKELLQFVAFANQLYSGNEYFVHDIVKDELDMFNPKKNPAYEHCTTRLFLAYQNDALVGRIAGIHHMGHIMKTGRKQLRFTRFDAVNDIRVSKALFHELHKWATSLNLEEIIGPIGFCDFDKQGLLIEGFEELSMHITAYNHPYYADHLARLGFVKDADWVEYQIYSARDPQRVEKLADNVAKRYGFRIAAYRKKSQLKSVIPDFFEVLNASFMNLYGFVPLTDKQMKMYADRFFPLIQPDYFYDVRNANGRMIGFGLLLPSLSRAIQSSRGRLFPLGLLRIFRALKTADVLDCYLMAVRPEYKNRGVSALILQQAMETVRKKGIKMAESGPELESNKEMTSLWKLFNVRQHKRRRCFLCKVDQSC